MKIIQKAYLLLAVIIIAASVNLSLYFQTTQENNSDSKALIVANDLKVTTEKIARVANTLARGDETQRNMLPTRINEFDVALKALGSGGNVGTETISQVPPQLRSNYELVVNSWKTYQTSAKIIQTEQVFDPQVKDSLKYVLEKNSDLVITTDKVVNELSTLDRNYNRHKEIAMEIRELAKSLGANTLLISIGEGDKISEKIKSDRILFDTDLKKLLGLPLTEDEINDPRIKNENLAQISRENSAALRTLDPLWESIEPKLKILESQSLLSKEFGTALKKIEDERSNLLSVLTDLVDKWGNVVDRKSSDKAIIVQGLLIADIGVFLAVLISLRKSLNPLNSLSVAISRVKEGIYGEKIEYNSKDEIGDLAEAFNAMSYTIKEKENEAKQMEIAKDEFLAMITHELKTPLVPIQGYADILLRGHLGQLNKSQQERIEIIRASSASLLSLITDLLDAQKLELGQLRIKKENENIKSTIEKTIEAMSPQATADQIELKHTVQKDLYAPYDDERIRQVITNLIKNSLRATTSKVGKIEILAEDLPNEVRIAVKDNGTGIPKDKQAGLFKKFYQVDTSSTREKGGSGLGLSICKGIIETHGGKIWVESDSGRGATFTFSIPKTSESRSAI